MKRLFFVMTVLLTVTTTTKAASQAVLHNVYARQITSLNGNWQIVADPYDAGYYDYRLKESANGYFKNDQPKSKGDHVEYDFVDSDALLVPGDWNTQRKEFFFYEGSIWYKKDFKWNGQGQKRCYLYFGAVNYQAEVYLNGEKLGMHIGGYTPFNFDITDKVKKGDNFIVVRVNNVRKPDGVPTVNSDWWNYGGITRDVMLVETPETFVDDYSIRMPKGDYKNIEIKVRLNLPEAGVKVSVKIPELKINKTLTTNENGEAEVTVKAKPQLWSPEKPKLYEVLISCNDEQLRDEIGFRHIETSGNKILLNGKEIFLSGISVHEEAPFKTGRCTGEQDDKTLISWAKELGCNFLRLAHYPHNEQMVRLAEREGLLLWSEIPVYWTIHWDNPATYENALSQLRDNMKRDHNRCAIIVWSVANETPHSEARDKFLAGLAQEVRANDDERLLSMAMEVSNTKGNVAKVRDYMSSLVDIISFNCYLGWYGGKPADCDTRQWIIPQDKPFFISEFGAGAVAGLHGDAAAKWTEEYQAEVYRHTLAMYDRTPGFSGCSPWILMDFRSPRRQNHQTQNFFNRKGIVSEQGVKKQAFFVLQEFYRQKNTK